MMLFRNGYTFNIAIECCPPAQKNLPYVAIEMSGAEGCYQPVIGKVDTGAFRTMLNLDTARALGFEDITSVGTVQIAHTATGEEFEYFVHSVLVQIGGDTESPLTFPIQAGFSQRTPRNLFGIDWVRHLCIAMDLQAVHFLND